MALQVKLYYTLLLIRMLKVPFYLITKTTEITKERSSKCIVFIPIYLDCSRMKTIYDYLSEYKNVF